MQETITAVYEATKHTYIFFHLFDSVRNAPVEFRPLRTCSSYENERQTKQILFSWIKGLDLFRKGGRASPSIVSNFKRKPGRKIYVSISQNYSNLLLQIMGP